MTAIFAFIVCLVFGAPWWVFLVGFLCLIVDGLRRARRWGKTLLEGVNLGRKLR